MRIDTPVPEEALASRTPKCMRIDTPVPEEALASETPKCMRIDTPVPVHCATWSNGQNGTQW